MANANPISRTVEEKGGCASGFALLDSECKTCFPGLVIYDCHREVRMSGRLVMANFTFNFLLLSFQTS